MKKSYIIIIIFLTISAVILVLTGKNKVKPKPTPLITNALMTDTTHYHPLNISKELRDALLEITAPDNFTEITNEFFSADTLCQFSAPNYLVNIRYTSGCNSPGYCNMIFRVEEDQVKRINDIKGYMDSTECATPAPYLYITLPDGSYMKRYKLVYTSAGFRFKNFIATDSVSDGKAFRLKPSKTDLDAKVINSEIR